MFRGLLIFVVCALAGSAAAGAPAERITPLTSCSKAKLACLIVPLQWLQRPVPRSVAHKRREGEPLLVRGRLSGGAPRVFQFVAADDDDRYSGRAPGADLGGAAYLGRTRENRPIILTDRGPFEIEAPYIDVADRPGLIALDDERKRVVARYLGVTDGEYVVATATDVAVWDSERDVCIVAPRRRPGLLAVANGRCKARTLPSTELAFGRSVSGNVTGEVQLALPDPYEFGLGYPSDEPVGWGKTVLARGSNLVLTTVDLVDECGTDEEPDYSYPPLDRSVDWMAVRE